MTPLLECEPSPRPLPGWAGVEIEPEDARSILSAAFIDYEKVQSLAQPDQGDYTDPELVAELDTLEDCEHTISR